MGEGEKGGEEGGVGGDAYGTLGRGAVRGERNSEEDGVQGCAVERNRKKKEGRRESIEQGALLAAVIRNTVDSA